MPTRDIRVAMAPLIAASAAAAQPPACVPATPVARALLKKLCALPVRDKTRSIAGGESCGNSCFINRGDPMPEEKSGSVASAEKEKNGIH